MRLIIPALPVAMLASAELVCALDPPPEDAMLHYNLGLLLRQTGGSKADPPGRS